jgi:two-component system, NtrC family, response regulator HydG
VTKSMLTDDLIEHMVDGLFTVDNNRVITYWNAAAEKILGYRKKDVLGKTCDVLNSPNCMSSRLASGDGKCALFTAGKIDRKRCMVTAKNGSSRYLLKNARVLKDKQGRVIGGVENIVDITEQVEKENEIQQLRRELKGRCSFCKIVGSHYTMQNIYELIDLAKDSSATVLIYGESGTGKELVAQAIHHSSSRRNKPFVKVNCAALTESLLESELFGHVKGAFTDAIRDRKGRFEEAHGGTIFLDEIGDLPLSVQVKLLRVLQDKVIERVGENRSIKVDVRIIAATLKNLQKLIDLGQFREDLYYRLNVIPISVPPLRSRKTDIPLLADHFMNKFRQETGKLITACDKNVLDALLKYSWPGNVRELENTLEYAFVTCRTDTIKTHNLPEHIANSLHQGGTKQSSGKNKNDEKIRVMKALDMARGNKTKAAQLLGLSRVGLWKKIKRYNLSD